MHARKQAILTRSDPVYYILFADYPITDLRATGLAWRHVRGFESEEISVDYMQIHVRVKTGAVF